MRRLPLAGLQLLSFILGSAICWILLLSGAQGGSAAASGDGTAPPDSIFSWIEAAGDSTAWPGAGIVGVFDRTEVRVEPSGLGHVSRRRLAKILTEEGARSQATLRFDYDPASNMIRLDAIRIHRAGGGTESIDTSIARDLSAPAEMIYWGARMKIISVPRLRVGDAVEVETYKKGFQIAYLEGGGGMPGISGGTAETAASAGSGAGTSPNAAAGDAADDERYIPPMRGHFYDVVTFQEAYPLKEKTYRLRIPRDKPVQFAVYNGTLRSSLAFADSFLVYAWQARDVAAFEEEARMPDPPDVLPKVVLATVESWPEKSRWFFEVNEPQFEADDAIRRKVAELTKGLKSDDEKMAALLHWVAQEIRYSGLSMGRGEGYTLHPGIMDFEDRCGVCKDIAGMLVTMLRAAGFTTYPVMTQAGARVEAVPADQFNHCVVAVERPDGSFTMLDPTWAPFDKDVWSHYEGEQHYVIGSPRGENLQRIRSFAPGENRMSIASRSNLAADGSLDGEMTITGIGSSDSRMRGMLGETPAGGRAEALAALLGPLGAGVSVTDLRVTEPRDFSRAVTIFFRYRINGYAGAAESLLAFRPPALRLASSSAFFCRLLAFSGKEERKHEALLWFAQEIIARDEVAFPPGFRYEGQVDSVRVEKDAGTVRGRVAGEGNRLRAELTAVAAKRTVPASEWSGGVEAADSLRAFGERVRWSRRGR